MAKHDLAEEFAELQRRINLGGRAAVAQAAHLEVRDVLHRSEALRERGLQDVLIGSYARHTAIWPGKDVDVFGKLTAETVGTIEPLVAYDLFVAALAPHYGARMTLQPRSIKIAFGAAFGIPDARHLADLDGRADDLFDFAVDVVPAVRWDDHWGIPARDRLLWGGAGSGRWVQTDPEAVTEASAARNADPLIGGQGGFVPTVKAIKQMKTHHLPDRKPARLFYEFILHEGFGRGAVAGPAWADLTASALAYVAARPLGLQRARPRSGPRSGVRTDTRS